MRPYYLFVFIVLTITANAQKEPRIHTPPDAYNQQCRVSQWIGPVEITITYNSPDIHGRSGKENRKGKIWGQAVKYGFEEKSFVHNKGIPWRAGANENTTITLSHDVKIQGKLLKAGTYGLFLVVAKEGPWTWIFSNESTAWGSFSYEESEDALRVETTSQDAVYTEWLTYGFDDRFESSATAYLQWDEKKIPFKIEVDNIPMLYLNLIKKDLIDSAGLYAVNYVMAANFCVDNNMALEDGLQWANKGVSMKEDFTSLRAKASVLTAMGKLDEAKMAIDRGLNLPSTSSQMVYGYGRMLLVGGEKEQAMEVFKLNNKRYPDEKFFVPLGFARGYTAL